MQIFISDEDVLLDIAKQFSFFLSSQRIDNKCALYRLIQTIFWYYITIFSSVCLRNTESFVCNVSFDILIRLHNTVQTQLLQLVVVDVTYFQTFCVNRITFQGYCKQFFSSFLARTCLEKLVLEVREFTEQRGNNELTHFNSNFFLLHDREVLSKTFMQF